MPGLQFEQLPESTLDKQIQSGRQQIQDKYATQWQEVNRSKRFLGPAKHRQMLRQIDMKAKQEMLRFNQQAQQQFEQLQRVTMMGEQGLIPDADRIKAEMVFGHDVAASMYPREKTPRSIALQFGELDVFSHRVSQELESFQMVEKRIPKLLERKGGIVGWPLPKEKRRQELHIMDYNLPSGKKDKFGDPIMGKLRKTNEQETETYNFWRGIEEQIKGRKRELLGRPDISRRIVQPGTEGGTLGDKVAKSVKPRQRTTTKPRVIRQRNTRTGEERISYDGGRSWQTSG